MLLPILLWGPHPPSHTTTSLFLSRDDKILISGSTEGQLLVCDVFPKAIIPRCFLVGHSSEIVCIDQLHLGLSLLHVVSAASNGEIYKWNVTDGSHLLATTVQGPVVSLEVLPSSQNVLVCGQYGAITILDPLTLDVKHLLVPSDPTHWILCFSVFQPPKTKDEEVVCMTVNGQVKTWNLQQECKEKVILESETKVLICPRPVCLRYNPKSLYNCLIVCENTWRIYRGGDFVLLCSDSSNQEAPWTGGRFYLKDRVMLWKENGMIHVYQLPARAIRPVDHNDTSWTAEPSTCLLSVDTGPLQSCVILSRRSMRTPHDVLLRGDRNGRLSLWKPDKEWDIVSQGLGKPVETCLAESWDSNCPGIVNNKCCDCTDVLDITASVSLEPLSYAACGLSTGNIIVSTVAHLMIQALFCPDGYVEQERKVLSGHQGCINVLFYPHTLQPTFFTQNILYSGGSDFSIKIWDWQREHMLQSFTVHSGPLERLFLPPVEATGKLRGSVISVCTDNTISITKSTQVEPLFVGACHHTGILDIRWRLTEDILIVHCLDDTVYVWGLSTGHLDRLETGSVALSIISASNTPSVGQETILKINPPGVSFPKQTTGLSLIPFRFKPSDNMGHMVLFDTELLLHLLSLLQGHFVDDDDVTPVPAKNTTINFEMLRKKVVARTESRMVERRSSILKQTETAKLLEERSVTSDSRETKEKTTEENNLPVDEATNNHTSDLHRRAEEIKQTCSILLSCLHAWGVDSNIDRTCLKHLGLLAPRHPLCYGTVSSNSTFMLLLPQWEQRMQEQTPMTVHAPYGRWCISSTLTTQHLLSVSALANKQMSTDLTLTFNQHVRNVALKRDNVMEREEMLRQSINESEKKAGWSHVTALHCIVLPEHVPIGYCSPLLPHLAIKWQDRCMEVREASQALFLRELRRIGFAGRQQLVNQWYPYIVRKREHNAAEPLDKIISIDLPAVPEYFKRFLNIPTKSVSSVSLEDEEIPTDFYSVSVIILGVIVAEFGDEVELKNVRSHAPTDRREAIRSSFLLTNDMLKMVAVHLYSQLTIPPHILPLHSPLRRASVDLIGRGYGVWCEFMNLTAVVMTLLELQTDPMVSIETKKAIAQSGNLPGTGNKERLAAAATVRAAYQASILIANNRPQHTINALSKEILTFKCDVEAGLSVHSMSQFPSSYHAILDKGRYPIYLLVQNVIEKTKPRDLAPILVKIVEIMLFCIDTDQFKTRTLGELVPSLTKNPLIDYCATTQQVAVGSNEGLVHVFDIRSSKCTPLHAHNAATTAVSLAANGRTLVTYSEREGKVSIWQSSSGLLSLMSPGPLKLVRTVDSLGVVKPGTYTKTPMFKWDAPRLITLYTADGNKKSFAV